MNAPHILLVDDDPNTRKMLRILLEKEQMAVSEAATAEEGYAQALDPAVSLVVLDISIPQMGGERVLEKLRGERPGLPVVIATGMHDVNLAVRCLKAGAADFVNKPCDAARLMTTVRNALRMSALERRLQEVEAEHHGEEGYGLLYGKSASMRKLFAQLRLLEKSEIGVLIEGASGTGKELVARTLHRRGTRAAGPFVALNCGAIPETMLESELFGHEKGAFTGAHQARAGCFEQADGGTLFLDEIGEMRPDLQVRLLRALENRELRRLGGSREIRFNVRVIAATNCDMREALRAGRFREDLFYRLAAFRVQLPALRERREDILGLAGRFLDSHARGGQAAPGFEPAAAEALLAYTWPGNVRELRNAIERAVLLSAGARISARDLPDEVRPATRLGNAPPPLLAQAAAAGAAEVPQLAVPAVPDSEGIAPFEEEERRILQRALQLMRGDVTAASQRLQIGRATLYRKIKSYKLAV